MTWSLTTSKGPLTCLSGRWTMAPSLLPQEVVEPTAVEHQPDGDEVGRFGTEGRHSEGHNSAFGMTTIATTAVRGSFGHPPASPSTTYVSCAMPSDVTNSDEQTVSSPITTGRSRHGVCVHTHHVSRSRAMAGEARRPQVRGVPWLLQIVGLWHLPCWGGGRWHHDAPCGSVPERALCAHGEVAPFAAGREGRCGAGHPGRPGYVWDVPSGRQ